MGLDGVELLIAVERSFKIAIEDAEAVNARTPGQLLAVIMSKLDSGTGGGCLSSHAFYRIRSALVKVTGLPRRAIGPATRTESLWPPDRRRAAWNSVAREVGVDLPPLERPHWLVLLASSAAIIGALVLAYVATYPLRLLTLDRFAGAAVGSGAILACALTYATRPMARCVPAACETVGGLTRKLLGTNFNFFAADRRQWRAAEVWDALQSLIAQQLSVSLDEVTKDARFVEDLSLD
jgi:acyl carrier protein